MCPNYLAIIEANLCCNIMSFSLHLKKYFVLMCPDECKTASWRNFKWLAKKNNRLHCIHTMLLAIYQSIYLSLSTIVVLKLMSRVVGKVEGLNLDHFESLPGFFSTHTIKTLGSSTPSDCIC